MKALVLIAVQVGVTLTVFGFGLNAAVEDLRRLISQPGLLVRSLLAVFVVMPILAVALVTVFDLHPTVRIALVALAISPVPPLIPRRESMARGSTAYGLGLMPILAALSILTIPVSLGALNRILDRSFQVSPAVVASIALRTALVPLAAGIIVRALMPAVAARIEKPVSRLASALVIVAVVGMLAGTASAVWALVGNGTIVAMIVFTLTGLAVGHLLGGPDPDRSVVLALSTACRHPAMAVTVASANFPDERFGGAIVLYLIVSVLVTVPYLVWRRWTSAAVQPAARPV